MGWYDKAEQEWIVQWQRNHKSFAVSNYLPVCRSNFEEASKLAFESAVGYRRWLDLSSNKGGNANGKAKGKEAKDRDLSRVHPKTKARAAAKPKAKGKATHLKYKAAPKGVAHAKANAYGRKQKK